MKARLECHLDLLLLALLALLHKVQNVIFIDSSGLQREK
jgi:hypothetical protein